MAEYHAEIQREQRIKRMLGFQATHPSQVVRKIAHSLGAGHYQIYVLKDDGFAWRYQLTKSSDRVPVARLTGKLSSPLNHDEMDAFKAGNLRLAEVL